MKPPEGVYKPEEYLFTCTKEGIKTIVSNIRRVDIETALARGLISGITHNDDRVTFRYKGLSHVVTFDLNGKAVTHLSCPSGLFPSDFIDAYGGYYKFVVLITEQNREFSLYGIPHECLRFILTSAHPVTDSLLISHEDRYTKAELANTLNNVIRATNGKVTIMSRSDPTSEYQQATVSKTRVVYNHILSRIT